jgi:hypothetical protein
MVVWRSGKLNMKMFKKNLRNTFVYFRVRGKEILFV